jgi:hypothetical protein
MQLSQTSKTAYQLCHKKTSDKCDYAEEVWTALDCTVADCQHHCSVAVDRTRLARQAFSGCANVQVRNLSLAVTNRLGKVFEDEVLKRRRGNKVEIITQETWRY